MIEKIKEILKKNRSIILYLLFGGLTTLVDLAIRFSLYLIDIEITVGNINLYRRAVDVLAWICAVLFAFYTNRIWVFGSTAKGFVPILRELVAFAGGRIGTFLLQEGILFLFCNILHQNDFVWSVIAAVLVVILNYVISKLLVFRKKKGSGDA